MTTNKIVKKFSNVFGRYDLVLYHSNINECEACIEAIVNSTGARFDAVGGVAKALMRTCGSQLEDALRTELARNGNLQPGETRVTDAFKLAQRHILHVYAPTLRRRYRQQDTNNAASIVSALFLTYQSLIRTSFETLLLDSFGTPLVSTGLAGVPYEESMEDLILAMHSLRDERFLNRTTNNNTNVVIFVINNERGALEKLCKLIDDKIKSLPCVKAEKNDPNDSDDKSKGKNDAAAEKSFQTDDTDCVICMDKIDPKKLKKLDCGHKFCSDCIDHYFANVKKVCPICQRVFSIVDGTQPANGTMRWKVLNMSLPGFDSVGTIEIVYSIPSGVQTAGHPNPGRPYTGCVRTAYLPDTSEGRRVRDLLKKAFDHKLIFTVGQSRTTGADNCVTWNDIHHKTSISGGPTAFGYPDPNYLSRVIQELAAKGIQ